jgi:phage-related protein
MMPEAFTWTPDAKPTGKYSNRTKSARFGDGYEQVVADGINNESQSWPLTFTSSKVRADQIMAFLRARKGYQSFSWKPPFGDQALFRCTEYTATDLGGGQWAVSATFDQSFQP